MNELSEIRDEIDSIDEKILSLLEQRFSLMPNVADCKKQEKIKTLDKKREQEIILEKISIAENKNIDKKFVISLFELIMNESKKIQKNYLNK